jgi:hypothetical protein
MFEQGQPMYHFYGYKTAGINPATGNPIFLTKDGKQTDNPSANDQQNIGSPIPTLIFGANFNASYKGFDFTLGINGQSGNQVMLAWIRPDRPTMNLPTYYFDNRWTATNTGGTRPKAGADPRTWNSDQVVFDGSFLRIQTIQFGYNFPKDLVKKAGIGSLRAYCSIENAFLFTKYVGMDPQASPAYGYNYNIGVDRGSYPVPRNIMLGASLSF